MYKYYYKKSYLKLWQNLTSDGVSCGLDAMKIIDPKNQFQSFNQIQRFKVKFHIESSRDNEFN